MKIAIGGDHAGYDQKKVLIPFLESLGHTVKDFGPFSDESVDYPDFVHPICEAVEQDTYDYGILICGSGNGVAITANKHQNIRAALCWVPELSALARQHNNANVLCLAARFVDINEQKNIIEAFLQAQFEGGRHERRVKKMSC